RRSTARRSRTPRRTPSSTRRRACSARLLRSQVRKPLCFGGLELAPLAGFEPFERQACIGAAVQSLHRMADRLAHPLHLAVAALVEDELDLRRAEPPRLRRRGATVLEVDAVA